MSQGLFFFFFFCWFFFSDYFAKTLLIDNISHNVHHIIVLNMTTICILVRVEGVFMCCKCIPALNCTSVLPHVNSTAAQLLSACCAHVVAGYRKLNMIMTYPAHMAHIEYFLFFFFVALSLQLFQ